MKTFRNVLLLLLAFAIFGACEDSNSFQPEPAVIHRVTDDTNGSLFGDDEVVGYYLGLKDDIQRFPIGVEEEGEDIE